MGSTDVHGGTGGWQCLRNYLHILGSRAIECIPVSTILRAGLGSFTGLSADRGAADGMRMNPVRPGVVDSYEVDEQTPDRIPMGRLARRGEIADAVSSQLSRAHDITGQIIRVDRG